MTNAKRIKQSVDILRSREHIKDKGDIAEKKKKTNKNEVTQD